MPRARLPSGDQLKASQRGKIRISPASKITPSWGPGDPVKWKRRPGIFRREVGDGEHAEIAIGERIYRVPINELG
jgi:hypothetical protein